MYYISVLLYRKHQIFIINLKKIYKAYPKAIPKRAQNTSKYMTFSIN